MDIAAIFSSLSTAIDLGRSAIAARDEHKVAEAEQRITRVLIDVQNACIKLQQELASSAQTERADKGRIHKLESQLAELEQRACDRARYELATLSEGVHVLALKENAQGSEPKHYLCQPCMDNRGKKAVLQRHEDAWEIWMKCPECQYQYSTGKNIPFSA